MNYQNLNEAERIVFDFFSVYSHRDYDKLPSLIAANIQDHSPAQARNLKDAIRVLRLVEETFPDLSVDVLDIFNKNDKVAARVSFSGTHSATYINVPASGKKITWEALEIFRVANGLITESWGYWPDYRMLMQMK